MATEIKWEKESSNNIRKWIRDLNLTNKQDIQSERSDWNFIVNMSDTILGKLHLDPVTKKTEAQAIVNELDIILDLYNNSTTAEEIDFIDE